MTSEAHAAFRFGEYELDVSAYELRRCGHPVRMERHPLDLLMFLVEHRGELVERAEIVQRLWGPDVFVDVDTGVNTAIGKVRQALRDKPEKPHFLETVSGKGYRFIARVEVVARNGEEPRPLTRIAVLPFETLGGGPEHEYLADGLTEETIALLGRVEPEHISVIGRTSVMAYKRTTKALSEIGRELQATYIVESSIRTEGEHWRIICKLIRAHDQSQIWSASYDSQPQSMLAFQRELSATIAEQIRVRLSPERLSVWAQRQTTDAEAYDLYLRGRFFWNQLTPPTNRRAIEYYGRATERDPEYALAWSGLADAYAASPINSDASGLEVWPRVREAVAAALRAAPRLSEVQTSLGFLKFWLDWDWPGAEAAFRDAIVLDRSYPLAHRYLGIVLSHMGRHAEARVSLRRTRELDPLNTMHHALSAFTEFQARDYAAAVQFAQQAIVIDPQFWIGYYQLGQAYMELGQHDLALEALHSAGRFVGGNSKTLSMRGYLSARLGRHEEAREVLRTLHAIARERYVPPYTIALVHAGLGDVDAVFDWLERAYEARDVHLVFPPMDPKWDPFRGDPRFIALMGRCGFVTEV